MSVIYLLLSTINPDLHFLHEREEYEAQLSYEVIFKQAVLSIEGMYPLSQNKQRVVFYGFKILQLEIF